MLRTKIYLILCLLQLLLLPAMAERSSRLFEVYNASNGLADNSAQVIKCTRTGRIVTATMGQINFFDGQSFTFIDATEENVYPLDKYRGNYHLYFDKYHHLWLKNRQTVTCVNLTTEKFVTSVKDEFPVPTRTCRMWRPIVTVSCCCSTTTVSWRPRIWRLARPSFS